MKIKKLSRRDFLKKTGQAALFGSAALFSESLTGCATFPKATKEVVDQISWDSNPILPMPTNGGIYIGTNAQVMGIMRQDEIADSFRRSYGKLPTFLAPGLGRVGASDRGFPKSDVKAAQHIGAIPMIRYVVNPEMNWGYYKNPLEGYEQINHGYKDDDIRIFGAEATKLEWPIIVCPFQQPNE